MSVDTAKLRWRVGDDGYTVHDGHGNAFEVVECRDKAGGRHALAHELVDSLNSADEIDRLRERGRAHHVLKGTQCCDPAIDGEIGALLEENDRLRKDAARYRAIRTALLSCEQLGFASGDREPNAWVSPKEWLDRLDAAIAAQPKEE